MRMMKDSGIEWIKKIPDDWNTLKGKNVLTLLKRPIDDAMGVITCFRDGEVTLRSNRREDGFTFADKEIGYQGICKGDLVIHGMDGFAGAIGISDSNGKSSPVLNVCKPKGENSIKYLMYYLRMLASQDVFVALATGIRERSCDLRWNKIAELMFPVPSNVDQQRIADFLDEKCAKIDRTIEQQKLSIEKLKGYKQSIITEAVTKGLDPRVPMKDSGIEWIGVIPEGWEIRKLKSLGYVKGRIGFKGYTVEDIVDEYTKGRAIVLGGTNIMKDGYISYDKLTYLSEYKYFESPEIILKGGEILITKVGAGTGENALYEYYDERVTINPNVMIFVSNTSNSKFINYYILSNYVKIDIMLEATKSGAQPAINQAYVKNIVAVVPLLPEQQQIADYLDQKCAKIDTAIDKKQSLIEKLIDYKKSLIYEAVTGKIEV
jgi:type I restriction enzyme S subunit